MKVTLDKIRRPILTSGKRLLVVIAAITAVLVGIALGGSAWADDPPTPYIGDGVVQGSVPPLSEEDQAILDTKEDLAKKYALVLQDQYDRTTWNGELSDFLTQLGEDPSQHSPTTGTVTCPSATPSCVDSNEFDDGQPTMVIGERNILYQVPQNGISQPNSYYCGAATAYAILTGLGRTTSYYGEALSQSRLARTCSTSEAGCTTTRGKYTQTDYWASTPWTSVAGEYPMKNALNKWRSGSISGWYIPVSGPGVGGSFTLATYKYDFTADIDWNWPVAGNVGELANATHLDQHPLAYTIWHWVAIRGYSNYGDNTHYVDSVYGATGVSWSYLVTVPNHRITTYAMWQMLQQRGFVW